MPESSIQSESTSKRALIEFVISDLPCIFISLALFFGGILLLSLRIQGWGLFFGIIAIPIGIAFTIYTLDKVARNVITPLPFVHTRCNICGKITFAREGETDVICGRCRRDIVEGVLKKLK